MKTDLCGVRAWRWENQPGLGRAYALLLASRGAAVVGTREREREKASGERAEESWGERELKRELKRKTLSKGERERRERKRRGSEGWEGRGRGNDA